MLNVFVVVYIYAQMLFIGLVDSLSQNEWRQKLDEQSAFYSNRNTIKEFFEMIWEKHKYLDPNSFALFDNQECNNELHPSQNSINFYFEEEHTLVAEGGRSIPGGTPKGNISTYDNKSKYMVRIRCVECYKVVDIVIDYSSLNIENIRSSGACWNSD